MTKRMKTGYRISTTALLAVMVLAIGLGATALYAARPGQVHEERGCIRYGGKFTNLDRLVCTALVHGPARQDWVIRYEETSGMPGRYDAGVDPIISSQRAGRCASAVN